MPRSRQLPSLSSKVYHLGLCVLWFMTTETLGAADKRRLMISLPDPPEAMSYVIYGKLNNEGIQLFEGFLPIAMPELRSQASALRERSSQAPSDVSVSIQLNAAEALACAETPRVQGFDRLLRAQPDRNYGLSIHFGPAWKACAATLRQHWKDFAPESVLEGEGTPLRIAIRAYSRQTPEDDGRVAAKGPDAGETQADETIEGSRDLWIDGQPVAVQAGGWFAWTGQGMRERLVEVRVGSHTLFTRSIYPTLLGSGVVAVKGDLEYGERLAVYKQPQLMIQLVPSDLQRLSQPSARFRTVTGLGLSRVAEAVDEGQPQRSYWSLGIGFPQVLPSHELILGGQGTFSRNSRLRQTLTLRLIVSRELWQGSESWGLRWGAGGEYFKSQLAKETRLNSAGTDLAIPEEILVPLVHLQLDGAFDGNWGVRFLFLTSPLYIPANSRFLVTASSSLQLAYQRGTSWRLALVQDRENHRFPTLDAVAQLHITTSALLFEKSL